MLRFRVSGCLDLEAFPAAFAPVQIHSESLRLPVDLEFRVGRSRLEQRPLMLHTI